MTEALPKTPSRATPSFAFSELERSLWEGLLPRAFGLTEQQKAVDRFKRFEPQPACVYCGSREPRRWDHLIAVMEGGATVLGNMVLACEICDNSKRHIPYEQWMRSSAPKSPSSRGVPDVEPRIEALREYQEASGYRGVRNLEEAVRPQDVGELRRIRLLAQELREAVETLISRTQALGVGAK